VSDTGLAARAAECGIPPLFDLLSDLLEASLPSRVVAIALEHDARLHFWQARLHDPAARRG
jgi:type VI secretion system protein ImpJ